MDVSKPVSERLILSPAPCAPQTQKRENFRSTYADADTGKKGVDATGILFYLLLIVWFLSLLWQFIEGKRNLWPVLGGFLFFEATGKILSWLVTKPNFVPKLQAKHVDSFINTAVSLLHSALVSVAVTVLLVRTMKTTSVSKMWSHEVLTEQTWPGAFAVLGASCGYSAYDQRDMLRRRLYNPSFPETLIHHAVLLTCFLFALCKNSCINYLILTLICEYHSIFLHLRKVQIMRGANRNWNFFVILEWTFNWVTYFTTRIIVHLLIILKLLVDFSKFGRGVEFPLALMGMIGLNVLNYTLGLGLYKAFWRELTGKVQKSKEAGD